MASSLVSCQWLKEQLDNGNPEIRVLDGNWNMPMWKRDAQQEYLDGHIPGAVRFDIAVVADKESKLPLTLPSSEQFAKQVGEMGVSNSSHVVLYDNNPNMGFYSVGRVWWMFKTFGHEKVSVVDGGLPKWKELGYPLATGPQGEVAPASYNATFDPSLVRNLDQVKDALDNKTAQLCDGRPPGRYNGTAPEPNPKLQSGHMIGSVNVFFRSLIDPDTKTLRDKDGIKKAFEDVGVDLSRPIIGTCGSAVVACMLALGLDQVGITIPVYDGSWTDWVQNAPDDTKKLGIKGEDL